MIISTYFKITLIQIIIDVLGNAYLIIRYIDVNYHIRYFF